MTFHVIARAVARPEAKQALEDALRAMLAPTRKEAGCLRYELVHSADDPNELAMIEEWRSEADAATHMKTAHVAELFAKLPALLAGPPELRYYRSAP